MMDTLVCVAIIGMIGTAVFVVMRMDKRGKRGGQLGREYEKKAAKLEHIDEKLFTYEEDTTSRLKIDFEKPRGLAICPKDQIYVVGDGKVAMLSPEGKLIRQFPVEGAPRTLCVSAGKLYIALRQRVLVYSKDGKLIASWKPLGKKAHLTSIAAGQKEVFVADAGLRSVHVYDLDGNHLRELGQRTPGTPAHFNIPSPYFDLVVGDDQRLGVVNPGIHTIETYSSGDKLDHKWGRYGQDIEGFCGCCNPVNIALLPGGAYVTVEKGLTRIKVLDSNGRLLGVVAGPKHFKAHDKVVCATADPSGCAEGGLDLAVDSRGRVVVLDPYTSEIRIFVKKTS